MSVTGKERREVPLPSQEGKKGVMQYALYVVLCGVNFDIRPKLLQARMGMWRASKCAH